MESAHMANPLEIQSLHPQVSLLWLFLTICVEVTCVLVIEQGH